MLRASRPRAGTAQCEPRQIRSIAEGPVTMADILEFRPRKPRRLGLCQYDHHAWQASKDRRFDVKQGRLVTHFRCTRCGVTRVQGT